MSKEILLILFILISLNLIFLDINYLFEIKPVDRNKIVFNKENIIDLYIYEKSEFNKKNFDNAKFLIEYQQKNKYNKMFFNEDPIILSSCGEYFVIIDYFWKEKATELGFENYCNSWKDNIDMGFYIYLNK
jgi:hypothetical protein